MSRASGDCVPGPPAPSAKGQALCSQSPSQQPLAGPRGGQALSEHTSLVVDIRPRPLSHLLRKCHPGFWCLPRDLGVMGSLHPATSRPRPGSTKATHEGRGPGMEEMVSDSRGQ